MKQIYYWRDIYGDFNLFAPYQYTIHRLFQGERSGLHFEKLRQTGTLAIYSIRLNSADRLLFTIYKDSICLLDVVLNHDYAKSRFLRHPNKVYDFIKTMIHADEIAWETSIDALPSSRAPAKFQPIDYFQHQFIILNAVQESILTTAIPAIISGPAGSGKTCSAIALLNQKACYYEEPIAYITRSRPLLESMKTMWKETYPEDIKVDFKTYDELYPGLSDAPDFYHWLSGQGMCGAGLPISPEQLWQEFRIRSGFEDDLSYFNLGQRQSTVLPTERHTINDLYHRYLDSHPSSILNTFTHRQPYQFIVVDEAQDLAYAQLKSLYFASYTQIIYLLGSHQILFDNISRTDYLKSLFYQSGYKTEVIQLPISYRSGEEVVKITNALIDLKTAVIGGASDKYESHLHVAEELKDQGRFELRSTSQNEDFLSPGPELAIITLPQLKEEAGAKFDTPLVFSVDEIKGLEFHTILIWKFLTDPKASIIAKKLSIPSDSAKTLHRAKTGQAHPEHLPLCDAWITAASRAKQHLVWFDDLEHGTRTIYQHLQKYSSKDKIISASAEKSQDWKTVYETLLHEGANQQAEAVYRQRLTQTSDLSAPKDDTSCSDFSTDYLVLKKFISSKKKLKLDPKIKKKLQETNIALNPILYLLKQEDGSEMIHQLQLKLPPNTIPHTIWLQACDEKSLSLIQLLSLENPKLAISIMDKFPKDTLSLLNFDPLSFRTL